jgi:hypothetical protein
MGVYHVFDRMIMVLRTLMNSSETHIPHPTDLLEWARETLELSPDLTATEMRMAILERLTHCEFEPPDRWNESIDALLPAAPEAVAMIPIGYYEGRESLVRSRLEEFARKFFDMPPDMRREEWQKLRLLTAPWPSLRICMTRLQPALDVDLSCWLECSPKIRDLGQYICRRFVQWAANLGPESWEQQLSQENKSYWKQSAKTFQRRFPELAIIFAPFLDDILRPTLTWTETTTPTILAYFSSDRFNALIDRLSIFAFWGSVIVMLVTNLTMMMHDPHSSIYWPFLVAPQKSVQDAVEEESANQRLEEQHGRRPRSNLRNINPKREF